MKTKILLITCLILLSINVISATASDEMNNSLINSQTNDNTLTESNNLLQENNMVYVDANSENDNEDGSIDSPYKTINNENLQKIPSDSKIYVSEGTYEIDSVNITKNISIIGKNREEVIFIPNKSITVFTIEKDINVNFFNFTLKNFESDTNSAITNKGNLLLENINMINNTGTTKTAKRGNIYNEGNLEVRNSTFENNTASFAAAIYNTANAWVVNSDFNTNHIYNVGGAIYSVRGNLNVYDSRFYKNAAVSGAAIYNAAGYMYVDNTEFLENDAEHFFGGAIYSTGITVVNNSIFDNNHANMDGGAITNTNNFTIINCSFIENFAEDNGGVIENVPWTETENGNLTILNSSFIGNGAGKQGGVIMNYYRDESIGSWATVTVRNCLFEENSASVGGVLYNDQYLDFQNCVFIYNEAEEYNVIYSKEESIKSLDNNWWGNNNPTLDEIGVMPEKWIILNFTNITAFVSNFKSNLEVSLNTNNIGERINSTIPERIVTFYAQKTVVPENDLKIISTLNYTIKSLGDDITVSVDDEVLTLHPSEKMDIIITCDPIVDVCYKDKVRISGIFTDINGRAIRNTNVNILINNKLYKSVTDSNGSYVLLVTANNLGINNVTLGYGGNDYYNNFEINTSFIVNKQNLLITCDPIMDVCYKDKVHISGIFTDVNGRAIRNTNVNILINNKLYKSVTDSNGSYMLLVTANNLGVNNVTLSYPGNYYYNSYETNTTFNVEKDN